MKRKKNPLWYRIGVLIFGGIFCFSAYMAGRDIFEARKEAAAFRKLSEAASDYMETAEQKDSIVDPADDHMTEVENTAEAEEKQELLREAAGYASLAEQNPDYVGWLKIPGTRIDYPVMSRASDPEYYLHRAFDGSRSSGGTPFLGQLSDKDSTCMIVYGHNMKNGSMFAQLKKFTQDEETYKKSKYFWIFTPEKNYRYEIISAYTTGVNSDTYTLFKGPGEEFEKYLEKIRGYSEIQTDAEGMNIKDKIITLSTCTGNEATRYVVQGKRVDTLDVGQ